ncbi:MAG: hypothetical protein ACWA40_04730 [Planktomarina sp.]
MKSKIILGFIAAIGLAACDAKEIDTAFENLGSGILLTAVEKNNIIWYSLEKSDTSATRRMGRTGTQNFFEEGHVMLRLSPTLGRKGLAALSKSGEYLEVIAFDTVNNRKEMILHDKDLFRTAHPELEYGIDRASLTFYAIQNVCWANDDQFWVTIHWERDATADGQQPYVTYVKYDVPTGKAIAQSAQLASDHSRPAGYSCRTVHNEQHPDSNDRMSLTNGKLSIDGQEVSLNEPIVAATAVIWEPR